ncbi:MAG: hypothetical protein M1150_03280 [Patescibacteria group bacterium]|nr:hypothetical protein [Patescibacteria group bacterium]
MINLYQRFVQAQMIQNELELLDLEEEECRQLWQVLENTYNSRIIDAIMEELAEEDKVIFLEKITKTNEVEVVEFLRLKVNNIEDKIDLVVTKLTDQVLDDIRELR